MRTAIASMFVATSLLAVPPAEAQEWVFTGTIASADQFDTYVTPISAGQVVVATLVCDEVAPGDRPLDPVLSAYMPSNPGPIDPINADFYNDDGFGTDDFPTGVDCNAFDSSFIRFVAPETGDYTWRVDGFGSSTGPYTLTITAVDQTFETIPTLDSAGLAALAAGMVAASWFVFRRRRRA
jgi:hypothetical protein